MHICFCRFLKNDTVCSTTQSSHAAPDYSKAVHLWHPKSPATTTEITLLFLQISDVCASCSAGTMGFHVSSIYIYHFVDELCNSFMSVWYRKLLQNAVMIFHLSVNLLTNVIVRLTIASIKLDTIQIVSKEYSRQIQVMTAMTHEQFSVPRGHKIITQCINK